MENTDRLTLELPTPWMNQAGTLGFSPRNQLLTTDSIFVTNPISPHSRVPSADRTMMPYPGGFLLHTGLPNAGWKSIRRLYAAHWEQSTSPVWVHVISADLQDLKGIVRDCEELEGVTVIELGLPPNCPRDWMLQLSQAARGEIPLVMHISLGEDFGLLRSLPENVSAVTIGTPRGSMRTANGKLVHGRLHGPGLFPQMLDALLALQPLDRPIILGGICTAEDGNTALKCGAAAVQIDYLCWNNVVPGNTQDSKER